MSMHLAIQEQLSVNQPPGIRQAYQKLLKRSDPHEAQHRIMEALGEVVWEAQRLGKPLDNERYLALIYKHTSRSEEHTSELQSRGHLVCRLLLEKKKTHT